MDWDDLKTFLAISREGTLSAAARFLGVTQTTVGRRLDALQKRAGAHLLQKTSTGYVLTEAGARVLANVETMEAEALAVELAVAGDDVRLEGPVRITTLPMLATRVLGPTLADFHRCYPDIVIEFDVTPRILSLARREADIALRIGRFEQNDVVARKLGEFTMGIYAAETYLAEMGIPDFAAGAPGHRKVTLPSEASARTLFRWFEKPTAQATVALRGGLEMLVVAAQTGLGLACLPDQLAASAPGLVRLEAPPAPPGEVWLGVHREVARAPRIRVVLDHIATVVRRAVETEVAMVAR